MAARAASREEQTDLFSLKGDCSIDLLFDCLRPRRRLSAAIGHPHRFEDGGYLSLQVVSAKSENEVPLTCTQSLDVRAVSFLTQ